MNPEHMAECDHRIMRSEFPDYRELFRESDIKSAVAFLIFHSISEGASRLSLPEGTLGQWVTAARKGLGTPGSRTVAELESEILQLRKALNEARLERDILKKATVDSIGQRNSYVKTWGCGGFLNETNIYSRGKSLCF